LTTAEDISTPPTITHARFFLVTPRAKRTTARVKKGMAIMLNVFRVTSAKSKKSRP
jgi:hypothetical protein